MRVICSHCKTIIDGVDPNDNYVQCSHCGEQTQITFRL